MPRGFPTVAGRLKSSISFRFICTALVAFWAIASSLETGNIAGRITGRHDGRGVPGAAVDVGGTELGASTDEEGSYQIKEVPTGWWSLTVSAVGYDPEQVKSVLVEAGLTTTVNLQLSGTVIYIAAPPNRDSRRMFYFPPDLSSNDARGWLFRGSLARTAEYGRYVHADRRALPNPYRATATVLDFPVPSSARLGVGICSPAITDGIVYFGSLDSNYYAVDIPTGKELWHFKVSSGVSDGSPAVDGHLVFLPGPDRFIHALDRKTGKEVRRFEASDTVLGSPAVLDGRIYYGSHDRRVRAAEIASGRQVWVFESDGRPDSAATGKGIVGSLALADGAAYFGTREGWFYAIDLKTGKEKWRFAADGGIEGTPAVSDGRVVFGTTTGRLYALGAASGKMRWEFLPERAGPANSPAISRGLVYYTARRGSLYALELETGYERWRNVTIYPVWSSPAVSMTHDLVYFGCSDSCLHAVRGGREEWYYKADSPIHSTPAIVGDVVYFGTMSPGRLVGLPAGGN